jgi:hypothetical protein
MATLTTAVYLEDAARSAGEAMTINGGSLTVRTDTRWHANSPASMTGSLGAVTISSTLGGGYYIDATNVRWLPFDAGSGTVPAVGTTITGGTSGANGYLLGVWASLTSAPTAVGAAMPASGFIKLREADAAYVDNDVLSGISATANGVDVTGWIEVVHDQATAITVPRLGIFQTRGDWFYLTNTSGSANQQIQVPTNGSATAYVPGVWIETSSGSDVYEFYPAIAAALMITANLGTDARSKFVCMETNGNIRIGHNGTTTVGYVPGSGCKVRIPNILGRQCTTGARATNALPSATAATRPDFTTTSAGAIDCEYFANDWYMLFAQPYSVRLNHVATFDYINISECATALDIDDGGNGMSASLDARTVTLTSNFAGGTVSNWSSHRSSAGSNDHAFEMLYNKGVTLDNVKSGILTFARSNGQAFQITQSSDITISNCKGFNQQLAITTSKNITINDYDHCDRYVGTTNTTGIYAIVISASSDNIVVDGLTFGLGGTIANVHPYLGVINYGQSSNLKFRNIGSRSSFLSGGSANNPAYIFLSSGNNDTVKFQRVYMSPTRTGAISTLNSDKNMTYEHVYGDVADTMVVASLNTEVKNCGATNTTTGQASVYGTHFWDVFTSDTAGRVVLSMNEPTTETSSLVTYVAGTPKFTSAGQLTMQTVNDEVIIEQSYFVKGCTDLPSTAPVVTGTNVTYSSGARWGNHDIYYQIDKNDGNGWNGSWQDLTGANLNAETGIDPADGFKLKYRIVTATASTTNAITYIRISTTSTLTAQTDNLYPLDTITLTISGFVTGSDVVIYQAGTETVRQQSEDISGTSTTYTYSTTENVDIGIFKTGYRPFYIRNYALTSSNASVPVSQTVDRDYLT